MLVIDHFNAATPTFTPGNAVFLTAVYISENFVMF
jgi:hypothetical protein